MAVLEKLIQKHHRSRRAIDGLEAGEKFELFRKKCLGERQNQGRVIQ